MVETEEKLLKKYIIKYLKKRGQLHTDQPFDIREVIRIFFDQNKPGREKVEEIKLYLAKVLLKDPQIQFGIKDGPIEEWYRDGVLHRDNNKPAYIKNNEYYYYINGQHIVHEIGPAYIKVGAMTTYCYYDREGNYHREDGPAYIEKSNDLDRSSNTYIYYEHGLIHRDGDGPSYIDTNGAKKEFKWFRKDKLHRDGDRPAWIEKGQTVDNIKIWYKNGVLHRDNDKPAYINSKFAKAGFFKAFYVNGKLHRYGDKPAFITSFIREYYKNDKLHRYGDRPAIVYGNGDVEYYKNGIPYREGDKPSIIKQGEFKIWTNKTGRKHRDGDRPAVVYNNGLKEWWYNGLRHRTNNRPAIVDEKNGVEIYYRIGKVHRNDGKPAIINKNLNDIGMNTNPYKVWCRNDKITHLIAKRGGPILEVVGSENLSVSTDLMATL